MKILITGATGFVGSALTRALLAQHHTILVLTRNKRKAQKQLGALVYCFSSVDDLSIDEQVDAVIHLAGARVLGKRWSARQQQHLIDSRIQVTAALAAWIAKAAHKPRLWIQASAIGFYGVRAPDEALSEQSAAGAGFMSKLCQSIESAIAPIADLGTRTVVLRLGLVLGKGGALPPLALPFRMGFGGRTGSGEQFVSWIHLDDVVRLISHALQEEATQGIYNAVAPQTLSQADFARAIAKTLKRPYWFHLPAAPLRLLLGEMGDLLLGGQRVMPKRLLDEGFVFDYPELNAALKRALE